MWGKDRWYRGYTRCMHVHQQSFLETFGRVQQQAYLPCMPGLRRRSTGRPSIEQQDQGADGEEEAHGQHDDGDGHLLDALQHLHTTDRGVATQSGAVAHNRVWRYMMNYFCWLVSNRLFAATQKSSWPATGSTQRTGWRSWVRR